MTDVLSNALGSAAAGIVSRCLTHPLDTAKARLQAIENNSHTNQRPTYRGPLDVLRMTASTEGIRGLYRGFGAVLIGGTPGTILYLCSYDIFKNSLSSLSFLSGDDNSSNFAIHFASGMLAESVACIIYVPVDVIKERLQVQHATDMQNTKKMYYKSSLDAMRQIAKHEGLSGIYKGYGATLSSFGPFSALYFVFYEQFKYYSTRMIHSTTYSSSASNPIEVVAELPLPWIILSSACAGALASFLTSPLDMAKLRLQIQRGGGSNSSMSMVECLQQAYRQDGIVKGLFRGAGARVLHFVPATTVTMTCYETCRSFIYDALHS